jgi:hypothetical protein
MNEYKGGQTLPVVFTSKRKGKVVPVLNKSRKHHELETYCGEWLYASTTYWPRLLVGCESPASRPGYFSPLVRRLGGLWREKYCTDGNRTRGFQPVVKTNKQTNSMV